jgi:Skp family chaperone for outer membrane proteins
MRIQASNPWRATHFLVFIALVVSLLALAPQPPAKATAPTCAEGGICSVGETGPAGGIVIYVGASTINVATGISTGGKYLEAAPAGFSTTTYNWCDGTNSGNTTLIGADSASLGGGASNTAKLVEKCLTGAGNVAATYSKNGYSDWFLPSTAELNLLNSQKVAIGLNLNGIYWGSNETLTFAAAALVTVNNAVGDLNKEELTTLWPIRAFSPGDPLPVASKIAITRAAVGTQRKTAFTTQPQITIQYPNNDTVTVSSAVVTATISSGGSLTGTTTATASSGVATFNNLGVDGTVGSTYTITYSAAGLTSTTATVTLTGTTCDGETFTCQVGDIGPGGGVIFYVASGFFTQQGASGSMCTTNCKYLESAPTTGTDNWTDNNYAWSGNSNTLIGASAQGSAIGTGYQNTLAIVGQSGAGTSGAASVTRAYRGPNNKMDWFLPSKDELHQMRLQRSFVAAPPVGAAHSNYWSSTESSGIAAIYEYFLLDTHYVPYDKSHDNGIFARPVRAFGPAPAPTVVYVAPTPVPYLRTLTPPKINFKDGKLVCTPGTYNAGYTLEGVVQGSSTTLFTPSSFTYNLLINGVAQISLSVTSSTATTTWNLPTSTSGSLLSCSVTVSANGVTNTDKSTDNTSAVSSALSTQALAIAMANTDYSMSQTAISKAYQKELVDNRAKWRSDIEKIRTDYYTERDRIKSLPSTRATRAQASAALKTYTTAQKKSAEDYRASNPAAAAARDAANKAALDAKNTAIAKTNAAYGTFIESIGYGVLIP